MASQPLVQFLVLGVAFYAAYAWTHEPIPETPNNVIHITSTDVSRLDAAWRARWMRAPTNEELAGLVKNHAREIALARHAVELGLDRNDVVMRRMLGQKLEGMIQSLLELNLSPTEEELVSYFEASGEQYTSPDLITFTHIFVDPDRRGKQTLGDAKTLLAELRALEDPTEGMDGFGDPFMLQSYYPGKTLTEIARLFGEGFARSVFDLSPEAWHGPVLSGYGVHLVYVDGRQSGAQPELDSIKERVRQDWVDARRTELQDAYLNEVLSSYKVILEDPATKTPELSEEEAAGSN